jgi:hypothetical protein
MKAPRCPGCGRYMERVDGYGRTVDYECCVSRTKPADEECLARQKRGGVK